jgi:hypothetical protein
LSGKKKQENEENDLILIVNFEFLFVIVRDDRQYLRAKEWFVVGVIRRYH